MLTEILEANGEKTEILEANGKKEERKRERERKREDMYCRYVWNVLKGQKRDLDLLFKMISIEDLDRDF